MQEIAKALIYVSPFVIAAMWIGSKSDTNWGAVLIGAVFGIVMSALGIAFKRAVGPFGSIFDEPQPRKRKPKIKLGTWYDTTGRELGDGKAKVEAPQRAVAVIEE